MRNVAVRGDIVALALAQPAAQGQGGRPHPAQGRHWSKCRAAAPTPRPRLDLTCPSCTGRAPDKADKDPSLTFVTRFVMLPARRICAKDGAEGARPRTPAAGDSAALGSAGLRARLTRGTRLVRSGPHRSPRSWRVRRLLHHGGATPGQGAARPHRP